MVTIDNFASKLFSIILRNHPNDEANEWRLLGQEQDGSLLFSWIQSNKTDNEWKASTKIGLYNYLTKTLSVLHCFDKVANCIQASVNSTRTYLAYVIKTHKDDTPTPVYKPYLLQIKSETSGQNYVTSRVYDLNVDATHRQILVQFLYQKPSVLSEGISTKFLVLVHHECMSQYQIVPNDERGFNCEVLVNKITWAQWDPVHQTLYYIHNRKPSRSLVEGEESDNVKNLNCNNRNKSPTLSGLQFHDDLPHESVLNIPLNLPHLFTLPSNCSIYEDDTVPLRIHDCALDLVVLSDSNGYVCVCHHYIYQPIQPTVELKDDDSSLVHLAYTVTVLHQSCVIHCVVPGIPWSKARAIKPLFKFCGEDHMMVFLPDICTHLLDITMHEPCCHVTTRPIFSQLTTHKICFTPLIMNQDYVLNLATLDLVQITVDINLLIQQFKSDTCLGNKLSILHYLILHRGEIDLVSDLISWQAEKPLNLMLPNILKEFLIATSYLSVQRNLPQDATHLVNLLPLTIQHMGNELEVKINDQMISLSQDVLWNASMMLLSPQQRIVPYRSDIWVKLWEKLATISKGKQRFRCTQVVEKLLVSLVCYQPESLSRSTTPMSPSGSLSSTAVLNDFLSMSGGGRNKTQTQDGLPFYEIESCTASKQEHIISVNLRELSMHLLKQSAESKITRFQWQQQTPMHVHAVATRYVSAQLEQSRHLCQILCRTGTFDSRCDLNKGFVYIEYLPDDRRHILFKILERYYMAVESVAFPLPQGFTSFFTYLGYKSLSIEMFLQYVQRNVFELQVDVMKIIMADIDNSKSGIQLKLKLLALLPRSRAKRLLNQWQHTISLMLRAREHSLNILSGVEGVNRVTVHKSNNKQLRGGLTGLAFTNDRLSALNTFFDLLTAKASLPDLDFGLLIEATESLIDY